MKTFQSQWVRRPSHLPWQLVVASIALLVVMLPVVVFLALLAVILIAGLRIRILLQRWFGPKTRSESTAHDRMASGFPLSQTSTADEPPPIIDGEIIATRTILDGKVVNQED